jgi:hypothetical protein
MLNVGKNAGRIKRLIGYMLGMFGLVIQNQLQEQKQYWKLTLAYIKFGPTSVGLFFRLLKPVPRLRRAQEYLQHRDQFLACVEHRKL